MIPTTLPASCRMALKEWASVLRACEQGRQMVFIRKGGLIEPGSGFEILAKHFLCYPTFEHQTVNFVRPDAQHLFEEAIAAKPSDGQVHFRLCGEVVWSTQSHEPTIITRLAPFHIYNDAFLAQRLKWQPEQPLVVAVVRLFRLPAVHDVPALSTYAGCKSWVELERPLSLEGATPVLDDHAFDEQLAQIRAVC